MAAASGEREGVSAAAGRRRGLRVEHSGAERGRTLPATGACTLRRRALAVVRHRFCAGIRCLGVDAAQDRAPLAREAPPEAADDPPYGARRGPRPAQESGASGVASGRSRRADLLGLRGSAPALEQRIDRAQVLRHPGEADGIDGKAPAAAHAAERAVLLEPGQLMLAGLSAARTLEPHAPRRQTYSHAPSISSPRTASLRRSRRREGGRVCASTIAPFARAAPVRPVASSGQCLPTPFATSFVSPGPCTCRRSRSWRTA